MLNEKYRKYFDACFNGLVDCANESIVQSAQYCCAQWICQNNITNELSREKVEVMLKRDPQLATVKQILSGNLNIKFFVGSVFMLCKLIRKVNFVDARAKLFYQYFLPGTVSDTSLFSDSSLSSFNNGFVSCIMIHLAMISAVSTMGTREIFDCLPSDVFSLYKNNIEHYGVKYDEFERYWTAVHWVDATHSVCKGQMIKNAVKVYQKYHVPVSVLLEHYAQINYFQPEDLRRELNPWEFITKKMKGHTPERGMSIDEKLFNDAAYKISRQCATDVIETLFYNGRNDSAIECALVRTEMKRLHKTSNQCLIVNPSPSFLKEFDELWEETGNDDGLQKENVTLAVNDEILVFLYGKQFDKFKFITIDSMKQQRLKYDHIVVLARDVERTPLWSALPLCEDGAAVTMLLPQSVITESDPLFAHYMKECHIYADWILDIPAGLSESEPKKKMLIVGRKGLPYAGRYIYLNTAATNERCDYLTVQKKNITVPQDWLYRGMTLSKMRKEALDVLDQKEKSKRNSLIYDFSNEIKINYQLICKDGQIERARAYYRNIHRPEVEKSRTKGKRPNDINTERGLRGTTQEQILRNLENVPLYEEYYDHIVSDVTDYYKADFKALTVKTLWFCCRKDLLSMISYDESIAKQMFCGEKQCISDLVSGACQPDDFVKAMNELYGEDGAGKKEWQQLYLVYQIAVDKGMLTKNPLVSIMHIVQEQDRKKLYMLNAALKKSNFTNAEEMRMVAFLCEQVPLSSRKGLCVPRYIAESKWLAGALSLFAGLPVREICPLLWRDFRNIDAIDEMQLAITKHLNSAEQVISNVNYRNKEHFRKIPVDHCLAQMLLKRKAYLMDVMGYTEETLANLPIMLDGEPSGKGRRKHTMVSRSTVHKVNKQLLLVAEIRENVISMLEGEAQFDVNLNAYRNDLFAANFRHKAYHICGFSAGELCHYLGNKGPDTYTRHYCDYGNDFLQYAMVQKLNRWTYVYNPGNTKINMTHTTEILTENQEYSTGRYLNGTANVELTVNLSEVNTGSVRIEIDCEHGLSGMIIGIGEV